MKGHKFDCTTKFEVGDIAYMRTKNYFGKMVKEGPIKIIGIELRIDSKGKLTVWYNCESANLYKFDFSAKGSKHYVKEDELYFESEVDKMGWDVESRGYPWSYYPDGSKRPETDWAILNGDKQG